MKERNYKKIILKQGETEKTVRIYTIGIGKIKNQIIPEIKDIVTNIFKNEITENAENSKVFGLFTLEELEKIIFDNIDYVLGLLNRYTDMSQDDLQECNFADVTELCRQLLQYNLGDTLGKLLKDLKDFLIQMLLLQGQTPSQGKNY